MFAFVYFIPVLTTLLWFVTFILKADGHNRRRTYAIALFGEFFFYILYSIFVLPDTDFTLMVKLDAVLVPISLGAAAILTMYIHLLRTGRKPGGLYALLFIPAIIIGSTVGILYYLIGFDTAAKITESYFSTGVWPSEYDDELYRLYYLFDAVLKNIFALLMMLTIIAEGVICIVREKSESKKLIAALTVTEMVLLLPTVLLGRQFLVEHHYFSVAIAFTIGIAIHLRSQAEFYNDGRILRFLDSKTSSPADKDENQPQRASLSNLLEEKVKKMMEDEQIYRDDALTVKTLASAMGVSRATMSAIVASAFGMPFREYLNRKRIDYAKEYMLSHPQATQDAIAAESGFKDGNLFNRKFRELEGETPLGWLVRNYKG